MERIATLLAALVAGVFVVIGQAVAAPGDKLVVDDDGEQCRNAEFTSIQEAVDTAAPGDRIKVCPGLYEESVTVNKTLFLTGKGGKPEKRAQEGDPEKEAIVDPPEAGQSGFNVQADNVRIRDFTVTGAVGSSQSSGAGIFTSAEFSGYRIQKNLIRDNDLGLYFNSSGRLESIVEDNAFVNNNQGPEVTPAAGNGIYSDQGLGNATISKNYFTLHENTSVILIGLTPGAVSNVGVNQNEIIDDGTIILSGATESEVNDNTSENSNSNGIQLGFPNDPTSGVTSSSIEGNKLSDGDFSGINVFNASNGNTFDKNDVRSFGDGGIRLREDSDRNGVDDNKVFNNGEGSEPRNGISTESESSENIITDNKARDNLAVDCNDETTGTRTSSTANTWENNKGNTENRPGLCRPKGDGDNNETPE